MKTISFVVPVYNEKKRLHKTFKALQELRLPAGLVLEKVIFVNDGSTDKTKLYITKFTKQLPMSIRKRIQIISYRNNLGKGFAVKQGMLASTADYTLFFDADMSTPLSELKKFMPSIHAGIDIIVGTRKNGKSTVIKHQPYIREHLGRAYTKLTQFVLQTPVTDFTCGFKAFSRVAVAQIFPYSVIHRWGYDAEILLLSRKNGFTIKEVPVLWSNDTATKVNLVSDIPKSLIELGTIHVTHIAFPFLRKGLTAPSPSFHQS